MASAVNVITHHSMYECITGSRIIERGDGQEGLNLRQVLNPIGAGPPQAQRIVMLRQADLPEKTRRAKKVIGRGKRK